MPSAAEPPMIEVERLTVGYGDTVVLENLDFTVPRGDVFAILGGSGSGRRPCSGGLAASRGPCAARSGSWGGPRPAGGPRASAWSFRRGASSAPGPSPAT